MLGTFPTLVMLLHQPVVRLLFGPQGGLNLGLIRVVIGECRVDLCQRNPLELLGDFFSVMALLYQITIVFTETRVPSMRGLPPTTPGVLTMNVPIPFAIILTLTGCCLPPTTHRDRYRFRISYGRRKCSSVSVSTKTMASPVDFISGPNSLGTSGNLSHEKTGSLMA